MQRIISATGVMFLLIVLLLAQGSGGQAAQVTATPSPATPVPPLTVREPSVEVMDDYLIAALGWGWNTPLETALDTWHYVDVSGDGESDLIIEGDGTHFHLFVIVMLWGSGHYLEPFLVGTGGGMRNPGSRMLLEDWTADSIPDIVFDYRDVGGGSDFYAIDWLRRVIVCTGGCRVAWEYSYSHLETFQGFAMSMQRAIVEKSTLDGRPALRVLSQGFSVYNYHYYYIYGDGHIHIWGPWLSEYAWNGTAFELVHSESREAYDLEPQSVFRAASSDGTMAYVTPSSAVRGTCQLWIHDRTVGDPFLCYTDYVTVEWRDITNDGVEEVVVLALSEYGDNKSCIHQHLLAYEWVDNTPRLIADMSGCVVQPDLYGVRLVEQEGDVTICAADEWYITPPGCYGGFCWYDLNDQDDVYRYDGTSFVLSGTIERELWLSQYIE